MTTPSEPSPPPSPISEDLPCIQCSYNLRTLLPAANCPECNFPVASTLSRFNWRNIDPAYFLKFRAALIAFMLTIFFSSLATALLVYLLLNGPDNFDFLLVSEIKRGLFAIATWWSISLLSIPPTTRRGDRYPTSSTRRIPFLNHFLLPYAVLVYYIPMPLPFGVLASCTVKILEYTLFFLVLLWISQLAANIAMLRTARLIKILAIMLTIDSFFTPLYQPSPIFGHPPTSHPIPTHGYSWRPTHSTSTCLYNSYFGLPSSSPFA